jgi:hypothetical protein
VTDRALHRALVVIAGLTAATGAGQAVRPGTTLRLLTTKDDPTSRHFFGTVGMFMVVVGGGLLSTLVRPVADPVVLFWSAVQKVGASVAVALGVWRRLLSPVALVVAVFDLFSGALILVYRRRVHGR